MLLPLSITILWDILTLIDITTFPSIYIGLMISGLFFLIQKKLIN